MQFHFVNDRGLSQVVNVTLNDPTSDFVGDLSVYKQIAKGICAETGWRLSSCGREMKRYEHSDLLFRKITE